MNETELVLSQVPLFASLPRGELGHLASTLRPLEVTPGQILIHEGEHGNRFYVIVAGQVEVIKALATADERLVGERGPGEFIGEMSLFNLDRQRTASVRAASHVRLLEMTRDDFDALLRRQPTMAYEMVRVLSARLRASHDGAIRDLQEKNRELMLAYEDLKAAQAQIIEKEKLERELQVAQKIQISILPQQLPELAGFDFGSRIVPMTATGGDFFDFIPLGDGTLGIAVGDVSGHGVPAALFMALTVTLLRAEACRECSPEKVLQGVNRQLLNLNKENMFVTVLYGVLNRATCEFTYVRAGHEPPILCNADGKSIELDLECGQILGLYNDPPLCDQTVTLASGDTLLLFTDGVTEAMDARAEMFGDKRLQEAVSAHHHSSAQDMCERVFEQVTSHRGAAAQHDDITLVCVQAR
jgi:serine phosphatase RsbU (regulator of sigma subunit)